MGFSGPLPLPLSEIEAWTRLYRVHLSPWEIQAIRILDLLWLDEVRKIKK